MTKQLYALFAVCSVLAGCATAPSSAPEFLAQRNTCSVLFGGGGMVFPDNAMNARWFKINSVVSNDLADALEAGGYDVDRFIVDIRDNKERLRAVSAEMQRSRCNKVVQVSNSLSGTSSKGGAKYFEFTVDVLGVVPGSTTLKREYQKSYQYPLTAETMQTLSMHAVAVKMAAELDSAHVINKASPK